MMNYERLNFGECGKALMVTGMLLAAVLWVVWGVFCAGLPTAFVLWSLGEWRGDTFYIPRGNSAVIIAAVLLGNTTGIAGLVLAIWTAGKVTKAAKPRKGERCR